MVAKVIEYDVSGVEERPGGTGVKVKPGVRVARIDLCEQRETKANGDPANDIRVGLNFGDEYDWGFTYVGLGDASDWKLAEFIRALKLKDKGKMDPDKQKGKFIRVKVNSGTYEGEYSPDMGKLMPPQPGDEEAWAAGNGGASELSNRATGPDEDDAPEPDGTEPEPDNFYREGEPDPESPDDVVGSYDTWSDEDLEAECTDRDLTLPGGRGGKKGKMIAALRADDEAWRESGTAVAEGGNDEPDDGDGPGDEYADWDLDRLKQEWAERELGDLPKVRGNNAEGRLKAKIIEELAADDKANPFEA